MLNIVTILDNRKVQRQIPVKKKTAIASKEQTSTDKSHK